MIVLNPTSTTEEDKLIAFDFDELVWKKISLKGDTLPKIDIGTSICSRGKNVVLLYGSYTSTQSEVLPQLSTLTFDSKSKEYGSFLSNFLNRFDSKCWSESVWKNTRISLSYCWCLWKSASYVWWRNQKQVFHAWTLLYQPWWVKFPSIHFINFSL